MHSAPIKLILLLILFPRLSSLSDGGNIMNLPGTNDFTRGRLVASHTRPCAYRDECVRTDLVPG